MAWLDGLDIPLVAETDQGFFEFGPAEVRTKATPERSYSERLWGAPGLTPVGQAGTRPHSPLVAYRWAYTDAALTAQLELEDEGVAGVVEPGHAAVRYTNPTSGGDALTTMRTEFHRLRARHRNPPVAHLRLVGLAGLRGQRRRRDERRRTYPRPG